VVTQGIGVGDFGKLMMGSLTANNNTMGLEDFYEKMLVKRTVWLAKLTKVMLRSWRWYEFALYFCIFRFLFFF
jgi:hypothetical protein